MELKTILPERYFSRRALPYWCILVLDVVTIVLAGMLALYLTMGGTAVVDNFWYYIFIWMFSLPLFIVMMLLLQTYSGVLRSSVWANVARVFCALIIGGALLECICSLLTEVALPFRPPFRVTAVAVLVAAVVQSAYRLLAHHVIMVDAAGRYAVGFGPREVKTANHTFREPQVEHKKINLCLAHMSEDGQEQKYVKEAFDTNWVVPLGPNVNAFEEQLAAFVGTDTWAGPGAAAAADTPAGRPRPDVAALASGTSAVHLALVALGVKPGDEVMVQSFTFCASTNPIAYQGATPVFVDSEPDTWNMDPDLLDRAIADRIAKTRRKPKAIIPVALYGMPYDAERIMAVARKYGIPVVEDAAEGMGSRFKGRVLGTFGDYGVLSFNGNKMITTSGGGALVCNGSSQAEAVGPREQKNNILWYATQAREAYPYYQHEAIGYNYRMSNVCAGIGRGQMSVLDAHIAHHQHVQALYEQLLADVPGITVHRAPDVTDPATGRPVYESNYWLCAITLDPDLRIRGQEEAYREAVHGAVGGAAGVVHQVETAVTDCQPNYNVEALRVWMAANQIEARPVWKPMHRQPVYRDAPAYVNGVSEGIFRVGMCLPAGPCVSDDDVRYIVGKIKEAIV